MLYLELFLGNERLNAFTRKFKKLGHHLQYIQKNLSILLKRNSSQYTLNTRSKITLLSMKHLIYGNDKSEKLY